MKGIKYHVPTIYFNIRDITKRTIYPPLSEQTVSQWVAYMNYLFLEEPDCTCDVIDVEPYTIVADNQGHIGKVCHDGEGNYNYPVALALAYALCKGFPIHPVFSYTLI